MIITVVTDKGGNGKTPISINIAMDNNFLIATNQKFNIYENENTLKDDRLLVMDMNDSFPKELKTENYNVVIDLAGQVSEGSQSVLSAIQLSDVVLVPIMNDRASINGGINTIQQIERYSNNIIVLATNLQFARNEVNSEDWSSCQDYKSIAQEVKKYQKNIKILPLKQTTGFIRVSNEIKSLKQISENNALLKNAYKVVINQFNNIYQEIGIK